MILEVQSALILRADAPHTCQIGVAQIRNARRDGALLLMMNGGGRDVRLLLSPDEARELGAILIAAAFKGAGVELGVMTPTNGVPKELPITQ